MKINCTSRCDEPERCTASASQSNARLHLQLEASCQRAQWIATHRAWSCPQSSCPLASHTHWNLTPQLACNNTTQHNTIKQRLRSNARPLTSATRGAKDPARRSCALPPGSLACTPTQQLGRSSCTALRHQSFQSTQTHQGGYL